MVHSSLAASSESSHRDGTLSMSRAVRDIPRVTAKLSEPLGRWRTSSRKRWMMVATSSWRCWTSETLCVRVTVHPQHSCCSSIDDVHCFQYSGADWFWNLQLTGVVIWRLPRMRNWAIQQVSASPESVSTRRCDSYEAARTGHVDAWRMYKETLQQIVCGSRSRTHVQTQSTWSASCIRESSATRQWAVGNEGKSAATRSWSDVSYNASCRNKNTDVRVTTKQSQCRYRIHHRHGWTRHQCAEAHIPGNHQCTWQTISKAWKPQCMSGSCITNIS